jgi:formylglycine-generating enzyme required for sulfatase activity
LKGGSWATPVVSPEKLAIATRDELGIDKARNEVGFRVVRAR